MVCAKNYETVSTFVTVKEKKPWPLISDTVYIVLSFCHLHGLASCSDEVQNTRIYLLIETLA